MGDHFAQLGLDRTASENEIKAKYRLLAKRHHPDLNPGCKKSEEKFKSLTVAYNTAVGEAKMRGIRGASPLGGRSRGTGAGPMPTARRRYGERTASESGASDRYDKHEWNRAHYQSEDFYDHAGSRRWNVNGPNEEEILRQARRRAQTAQQRQAEAQAAWAYRTSTRPHWRAPPPPRPLVRKPPALLIIAAQVTATAGIWAWVASTWHWT